MRNQFRKEYKWIVPIVSIVIICTACGKEQAGKKMTASDAVIEYSCDSQNNGTQIFNSRISKFWERHKEQLDVADDAEIVEADEGNTEENKEVKWDVDFEVVKEGYIYCEHRNSIDIYYPQLSGFEDSAKEDRINALIEEDVKKIIGEKNKEGDDTLYCIGLDYEIKFLNERMISILYKGMYGHMTTAHGLDARAITTTIDIEEEKIITLRDVVTDFAELSDMLLADEFEHITMWEGTTEGYEVSWLFSRYGDPDELEENLRERYQEWYTDGENFIVIIEDVLADYNEYSINIESVKHILDVKFLKKLE